jgi:predicted amidohydrolase
MKIALCQMENKGTIRENLEQSIRAIEEAALQKADLILFPEVQLTEFFPQYPGQDVSEYRVGQNSDIVKNFCSAAKDNQIMVVPNLYLYENGKTYDASLLIRKDGTIAGVQKMVHVAQANQFFEQDYYTPADDGFHVFDTEYGKIGIVVCFDRHYPESIRTEALMGADLILIPTVNTKEEPSEMFEWELRVQAFHNSVYIAMGNRVGTEGQMDFSGESVVIDANGDTIVKADDRAQILYTDIDLEQAKTIRNKRPYTNLRRTEFYL